ncbi:MAG: carbon-nitrogen hydrolase family protein [Planctomycetota bacterium]|nr:carbon-nitrogen hydrolase family protein [Planctomycetota bacterium]
MTESNPERPAKPERPAPKGLAALPVWAWVLFFAFDFVFMVFFAVTMMRSQNEQRAKADAEAEARRAKADADRHAPAEADPFSTPPAPGKYRVAAIQFVSTFGDVKGNRERLANYIREAAAHHAQIVVMPEAAVPGYMSHDLQTAWRDPVRRTNPKDGRSIEEAGVAEPVPGPTTEFFAALARELKIYLEVSLLEKAERESKTDYFNTAVLLGPDGRMRCHYRKLHPWPVGEATWAQPGDQGLGLCETEFGTLGLMICFDLSNGVPEQLKQKGATTILYPIGWVCPNAKKWFDEMLPEKARDWGVRLVGANWAITEADAEAADWQGYGCSRIILEDGTVAARAGETGDAVLYADFPMPKKP